MNQSKNNSIQGLRFWAISLIVASHCGLLLQGGVGNTIFFAMSGFFVCQPFVLTDYEYEYFSIRKFIAYYLKRIVRIIPVAWVCMAIGAWGFRFLDFRDYETENSLLLNMFFIKSKGHLWFLQQEIFFYICAPFLILLLAAIKKLISQVLKSPAGVDFIIFILLNVSVYYSYRYIPLTSFRLHGNGGEQPPLLWLFLIGMSYAYLYKSIKKIKSSFPGSYIVVSHILAVIYIFGCLALSIFSSEQIISSIDAQYKGYYVGWEQQVLVTYMAGLVILSVSLLSQNTLVNKFLGNRLFARIGNVSFSVYLIHGFMLAYFAQLSVYSMFMVVYLLSLAMAFAIYEYLEKPIMRKLYPLINRR